MKILEGRPGGTNQRTIQCARWNFLCCMPLISNLLFAIPIMVYISLAMKLYLVKMMITLNI